MTRRVVLLVVCLMALTACRLDVTVDVVMEPDGTGTVTMVAVADAELVGQVPELAEDLRLDDAIAAGWSVDGPTPTDDGGLIITLVHPFHSAEELANVLNSIGPPLTEMAAARTTQDEVTTNAISGTLVLQDGYASFSDIELTEAVGGLPFEDRIAASGLTPEQAMSFTLTAKLPGELVTAETGTEVGDGAIRWEAPLDGSQVSVLVHTVQRPASGGEWAGPLSKLALVLLIVWIVLAAAFIVFVTVARRRKSRRRALRRLR